MQSGDPHFRRIPYPNFADSHEFMERLAGWMRLRIDESMGGMIPKENTERFYHGRTFVFQQDDLSTHHGEFNKQSVENTLELESIILGDLQALPRFLGTLVTTFVRQMKLLLFQRVGEAAESVGNTVDARQHPSMADAYLEMFRKVEFGVDKDGKVSLPELVLHPSTAERLQEELSKQGPEFRQAIQTLTNQKIADALGRERDRLSKFKPADKK
jgi:hypothetical protein